MIDANETGTLGVIYLRRYWSRITGARLGVRDIAADPEADNILLAGLRIGIRETVDFLMTAVPSFDAFEEWVLAKNGGSFDPLIVERLNGALRGDGAFTLESILAEPVLSPADLAHWDEQGYVVVRQVVSGEQCQAALAAVLDHARISMDDQDSWYKDGIWIPLAHHRALWANRDSPRIHTAFAQIWGRGDLWMNVDVCGVNPPEREGYRFQGTPLHWDMPLAPPFRFGTQAILYLTDVAADQGAFSCVPGFHHKLEAWLDGLPAGSDPHAVARKELTPVPIAGSAGDLIIWNHALPHQALPNRASLPRVAQYLNMFPGKGR